MISGKDTDLIQTVLMQDFGPVGSRAVILVVGISFLSCGLSLQAAASRLLFAFARDRMIIGHKVWSRISEKSRVSTATLIACGVKPSSQSSDISRQMH